MTQYMLILRGGEDHWKTLTPEQTQEAYQKYFDWSERLTKENRARGGNELQRGGRVVRRSNGGIVDGPFVETKENVGGYFVIEASDYPDAVAVATGCPILEHDGYVEVRAVADHSAA